jgi:hypothetical protein
MPSEFLLNLSLDKAIKEWVPQNQQPRWLAIPNVALQVTYPVGDTLLLGALHDVCKEAYTESIKTRVVPLLLSLDKQYGECKSQDFYKLRGLREKMLLDLQTELQKAKEEALIKINRRCQQHQEWLRLWPVLQRQTGIKLVTGAVGAGASVAGLILSGGSVSVLAIYGTYRAVVGVAKTCFELYLTAEQLGAKVKSNLESLKKDYENSQRAADAKSAGKTVVNWVLNVDATTTVKSLRENNESWGGKLGHLYSLAFSLNGELNSLLNASEALGKQLGGPDSEKKKAALEKLEANVRLLLTDGCKIRGLRDKVTIPGAYQRATKGLAEQEKVEKGLKELDQMQGKGVKAFEKVFPLVASLALAGVGTGLEATSLAGEAPKALAEEPIKFAGKVAVAGVKTFNEGFEIGSEEVGPMVAAAWGLKDSDFEEVEETEDNKKQELEQAMTRPRSNAIGSMADAKARSIAAVKVKP